jgi:hypothetical protein
MMELDNLLRMTEIHLGDLVQQNVYYHTPHEGRDILPETTPLGV